MCGIVGIIGRQDVAETLVEGLRRLEYRGYDSAGIATLVEGKIERRRAQGKLKNLEKLLLVNPLPGTIGIGHTRWATHGIPNEVNAHPHATERVAVVHNGIIENFQELRAELAAKGHQFVTQTDTEAVVHLIDAYLKEGMEPEAATHAALKRLEGAFALGIIFAGRPDIMIAARRGSPLAIGRGEGEMYLGSDALALAPLTRHLTYLEEGDWAVLTSHGATIHNANGHVVDRPSKITQLSGALIGKGEHRHYMKKEIYEQPQVIGDTIQSYYNPSTQTVALPDLPFDLKTIDRITIVACGTSYYAGMVGRYWFEALARLPVEVDIASEFRYRHPVLKKGSLAIFISQSGETADTLAALRLCKNEGLHTLSIVNVGESTMAREAEAMVMSLAGPEIGVASTKAFTAQLAVLACLALALGRARGCVTPEEEAKHVAALVSVPSRVADVLHSDARIKEFSAKIAESRDVIYLGRGTGYPIALEGALKLKEISYIHAEGYAAGELKHGPIALLDENMPVIAIAPSDALFEKTASNIEEVIARGARVFLFTDAKGAKRLGHKAWATVELPDVDSFVTPLLYAIPIQLLAYHTAVAKGTDVDQPRNLAKSVTVE
ncbi:MAG: glutamine--fructose-6-phosphate transaminase (isomerizing) [Alphaproteobacteria bacterium]|nr:glutamine--fructose-6-phosphate transaminase (isomerizing) [Alphaproteobacteria bacterium]MBF0355609.1 glutamine--fructose-6-phosphate transaminase (isomerizing) [Alphaproteobacteria bacterium]